jgi:cobalamin biosynthesis protein CobD/CbiB
MHLVGLSHLEFTVFGYFSKICLEIFTYLPCKLIIIKVFFSPTDAQLDSLKNNFKFALKLTLKGSYMFRCEKHHPQGANYLSLLKVQLLK